jgi:NADPH:quinone reductase-like Zn-dependent oxidoreductase
MLRHLVPGLVPGPRNGVGRASCAGVVGGPDTGRWIGPLGRSARMALLSPAVSQRMIFFLARQNKADLAVLREFVEAGKITPAIDRTYPLSEAAEAIGYLETGHARGKVAITV